MSIKDTLICIDDLERKGKNLSIKDIFGLLNFLKEAHNCKIIFICNIDSLSNENKEEFCTQKDKLFDYSIEFEPTADDVIEIAYTKAEFLDNHQAILTNKQSRKLLDIHQINTVKLHKFCSREIAKLVKALDFDSSMRRFESFFPCQTSKNNINISKRPMQHE